MNIFVVTGVDQDMVKAREWKDARGSSLSEEIHEALKAGNIVCIERRPEKIKFFMMQDGILKSRCYVADKTTSAILLQDFGANAVCENIEACVA